MKIALLQMRVEQANFDKNFKRAEEMAKEAASRGADLALLPEMFASGFNYGENKKALANRNFAAEFLCLAKRCNIFLAGTLPCLECGNEKPSNRMILASNRGEEIAIYDKTHLFGVFREDRHVARGNSIAVKNTPLGRIDLRFPEMFVQMAIQKADLILISAAWPHPRMEHIKTLAKARAIECQCFAAFANQAGEEHFGSNKICYCGSSAIFDPFGETVCECKKDVEDLQIGEVDLSLADSARAKIPVLSDRRTELYFKI